MEIITSANIMEYFREAFDSARQRTQLDVSEGTEFYVVNMLSEFMKNERLKAANPDNLPFGLMYLGMKKNPHYETLKNLGNACTYFCGMFPEHLDREECLEYYMNIGSRFYRMASAFPKKGKSAERFVLHEMVENLPGIVGTLNEMREDMILRTADLDLVDVYARWLKTGSERLRKTLLKGGVVPAKPGRLMS